MSLLRCLPTLGSAGLIAVLAACAPDATAPPSPHAASRAQAAASLPSGERLLGQISIEPAYDDQTGSLVYLATPIHSPFPTKANGTHATAPLYLVEYPPGSDVGTLNCMGVPGNCPDHDGEVAGAAVSIMPGVYGNDPTLVPGHDHLVSPPASGGDFNVAWEVVEVLFTNKAYVTHVTTEAQIDSLAAAHKAIEVDLGFAFTCAVVPATTYGRGTP